jgi:hypothetical protein
VQQPSHKLYILVDRTLTKSQQTVQACHAGIEFAKSNPGWVHQSIVILGVQGEHQLFEWQNCFNHYKIPSQAFRESYWENRFTALACWGCDDLVKELNLL